ncbi:MAG: carboxypeptidase regulatory-like domain-containing protein [Planctomycetes bacterium]|nr:carboxypeptidase regulatory-like domain-containing protein [Planctomycetota bacterium]
MRKWLPAVVIAAAALGLLVARAHRPPPARGPEAGGEGPASAVPRPAAPEPGAAPAPGVIRGTVRRDGRPAAAEVELRLLRPADPAAPAGLPLDLASPAGVLAPLFGDGPPLRTAKAGESGAYAFEGVPAALYEVRATGAAGGSGTALVRLAASGSARADVDLEAGSGTLHGRAIHADGAPFDGFVAVERAVPESVDVIVLGCLPDEYATCFPRPRGPAARTDAEGRFAIHGLAPGTYRLSCHAPGTFLATGGCARVPRTEPVEFVVDAGLVALSGRLVAAGDGRPLPGVPVFGGGIPDHAVRSLMAAVTGPDGRFCLRLPATNRAVRVDPPGFRPLVRAVPAGETEILLAVDRAARVAGLVVEEGSDRPLPGVTVFAVPRGGAIEDLALGEKVAVTDARGRFAIEDLPAGEVALAVLGAGYASRDFAHFDNYVYSPGAIRLEAGETREVTLAAARAPILRGRVVSEDGAPVVGASLTAERRRHTWSGTEVLSTGGTDSGPNGAFEIGSLAPGVEHRIRVCASGFAEVCERITPLDPATAREIEIRLAAGLTVEVRVVAADTGAPLPGASVGVRREYDREFLSLPAVPTDADGRAVLGPLPRERLEVVAGAEGFRAGPGAALLTPPGSATVEMERRGGELTIEGTALFADGTAPIGAEVTARGPLDVAVARAIVDDRGAFLLTGLLPGRYELCTGASRDVWHNAATEAEAGGRDVRLVLRPPPPAPPAAREALRIRVLGPDGDPVAGGGIVLHSGGAADFRADESRLRDGVADFVRFDSGTPPGERWVEVFRARSAGGGPSPSGAAIVGPLPAGDGEVTVRLPAGLAIGGAVRDEGGAPLPGIRVEAVPRYPFAAGKATVHADAAAGPDGGFVLAGLGDLEYSVRALPPPGFLPAEPVRARAGAADVRLVLLRGLSAAITVLDDAGRPLPGAFVSVHAYEEDRVGGRGAFAPCGLDEWSGADGIAVLRGIPTGQALELCVSPPKVAVMLFRYSLRDWTPGDTTVALERGLVVRGTVTDPAGRPVRSGKVEGRQADLPGALAITYTDADGSFVVGPFRPGPVDLSAEPPGPSFWSLVDVRRTVSAGEEEVRLVLDPGWTLQVAVEAPPPGTSQWDLETRLALDISDDWPPDVGGWSDKGRWAGGLLTFRNLSRKCSYALLVRHEESGRCVLRKGITAATPRIEVGLEPGRTVRGRVLWSGERPEKMRLTVFGHGVEMWGSVEEDGTFEIRGVPEAVYHVWVETSSGGRGALIEGDAEVTVDLR